MAKLITEFTPITDPSDERLMTLGDEITGQRFELSIEQFFARIQGFSLGGDLTMAQTKSLIFGDNSSNVGSIISCVSNPGALGQILRIQGIWNNNLSSQIRLTAGADSVNKDDGTIVFSTAPDGGTGLVDRLTISELGTSSFLGDNTSYLGVFTNNNVASKGIQIRIPNNANAADEIMRCDSGVGNSRMFIRANGNLENVLGGYNTISDIKLKENIKDANSQWDDIKAIKFRNYSLKEDKDKQRLLGVVAQEMEEVGMSGLVYSVPDKDEEGKELDTETKAVKQSILFMKCAVALQEAMKRIEALEAKLA